LESFDIVVIGGGALAGDRPHGRPGCAPLSRSANIVLALCGLMLVFNQFWPNIVGLVVVFAILGHNAMQARRVTTAVAL